MDLSSVLVHEYAKGPVEIVSSVRRLCGDPIFVGSLGVIDAFAITTRTLVRRRRYRVDERGLRRQERELQAFPGAPYR